MIIEIISGIVAVSTTVVAIHKHLTIKKLKAEVPSLKAALTAEYHQAIADARNELSAAHAEVGSRICSICKKIVHRFTIIEDEVVCSKHKG